MFNTPTITLKQSIAAAVFNAVCRGFAFIIRLPALIFDIPVFTFARKISEKERQTIVETLQAGDIVLTSDKQFPTWQLTVGFFGSPRYSHAAIYEGNNRIVEATTLHPSGNGVVHTPVSDFFSKRKTICVIRPNYPSEEDKNTMFAWLEQQLGKPFDYSFSIYNDSAMYCAKLVAKAMHAAGLYIGTKCYLRRKGYPPDSFLQMAGTTIVYQKRETIARKIINNLPLTFAFALSITGIAPLWAGMLVLLAAGWGQYLGFRIKN